MLLLQRDVEVQFLQTHFSQPVKQMYLFVLCCNNASCIQSTEKLQAINLLPPATGVEVGGGSKQEREGRKQGASGGEGGRAKQPRGHWEGRGGGARAQGTAFPGVCCVLGSRSRGLQHLGSSCVIF